MRLTLHTDYALRTLIYLGAHPGRPVPAGEVAAAYGVSANHLAKVCRDLMGAGLVRTVRGRSGGLLLAVDPRRVTVGAVVRAVEPSLALVECFDRPSSSCPITGACRLERTLHDAMGAFLGVLDRTTLADLLVNAPALATRLGRPLPLASAPRRAAPPRPRGAPRPRRSPR